MAGGEGPGAMEGPSDPLERLMQAFECSLW